MKPRTVWLRCLFCVFTACIAAAAFPASHDFLAYVGAIVIGGGLWAIVEWD